MLPSLQNETVTAPPRTSGSEIFPEKNAVLWIMTGAAGPLFNTFLNSHKGNLGSLIQNTPGCISQEFVSP